MAVLSVTHACLAHLQICLARFKVDQFAVVLPECLHMCVPFALFLVPHSRPRRLTLSLAAAQLPRPLHPLVVPPLARVPRLPSANLPRATAAAARLAPVRSSLLALASPFSPRRRRRRCLYAPPLQLVVSPRAPPVVPPAVARPRNSRSRVVPSPCLSCPRRPCCKYCTALALAQRSRRAQCARLRSGEKRGGGERREERTKARKLQRGTGRQERGSAWPQQLDAHDCRAVQRDTGQPSPHRGERGTGLLSSSHTAPAALSTLPQP